MDLKKIYEVIKNDEIFDYLNSTFTKHRTKYSDIHKGLNKEYVAMYDYGLEIIFDLHLGLENVKFILNNKEYNQKYTAYDSKLPFNLNKTDGRDIVRTTLGEPSSTKEKFKNKMIALPYMEQYDKGSYIINIQYSDLKTICDISIYFKEELHE